MKQSLLTHKHHCKFALNVVNNYTSPDSNETSDSLKLSYRLVLKTKWKSALKLDATETSSCALLKDVVNDNIQCR